MGWKGHRAVRAVWVKFTHNVTRATTYLRLGHGCTYNDAMQAHGQNTAPPRPSHPSNELVRDGDVGRLAPSINHRHTRPLSTR